MPKAKPQAEAVFTTSYLDDFVGLYLFFEVVRQSKEEGVALTKFKAWYKDATETKGHIILKFSEKFKTLRVPKRYAKEVAQVDALVDMINAWIDEFYQDETNKNIDEVLALIQQVSNIIKSVKPIRK